MLTVATRRPMTSQSYTTRVRNTAVTMRGQDAEAQGDREATHRTGAELEEDQTRQEGRDVGVEDRVPRPLVSGVDRRARTLLPSRSSSRMRSRMRMFASTAIPTVSTMPGDARQREGEPEGGERAENQEQVHDQREVGDHAAAPVVERA